MAKTQLIVDHTLVQKLEQLYVTQKEASSQAQPSEIKGWEEIYSQARLAMVRALPHSGFAEDYAHGRVGNWIAGQPLSLQLLSQPRLTVDLTVDLLKDSKPYGMEFNTFLKAAKAGCFYLNIRDFDSERESGFLNLASGIAGDRLARLLSNTNIERQTYIGSAVREGVFNLVAESNTLSRAFEEAKRELAFGPKALESYPIEEHFFFRGEKPSLTAVSFHKAFLTCVKKELSGSEWSKIDSSYNKAVQSWQLCLKDTRSSELRKKAACNWLELARVLRLNHLQFTAPITASWGTTYHLTKQEFLDSCCTIGDSIGVSDPEVQKWLLAIIYNRNRDYDDWDLSPTKDIANISNSIMERVIDYIAADDEDKTLKALRKEYHEHSQNFMKTRKDPFKDVPYAKLAKEFKSYMRGQKAERSRKLMAAAGSAFIPLAVLDAGILTSAGVGLLGSYLPDITDNIKEFFNPRCRFFHRIHLPFR